MDDLIFYINSNSYSNNFLCELLSEYLTNDELLIIKDSSLNTKKAKHIISNAFLKKLLCEKAHLNKEDLSFIKNKNGKPYLKSQNIFFNISHTNGIIVIGFSNEEIGIDIEEIKDVKPSVVNHTFTDNEKLYIENDEKLKAERFYEIWTKKEAYIKYIGESILKIKYENFDVLNDKLKYNFITFKKYNTIISLYSEKTPKNFKFIELKSKKQL